MFSFFFQYYNLVWLWNRLNLCTTGNVFSEIRFAFSLSLHFTLIFNSLVVFCEIFDNRWNTVCASIITHLLTGSLSYLKFNDTFIKSKFWDTRLNESCITFVQQRQIFSSGINFRGSMWYYKMAKQVNKRVYL